MSELAKLLTRMHVTSNPVDVASGDASSDASGDQSKEETKRNWK